MRGDEFALKKMRREKMKRMIKREKMKGYFLSFIRVSTVILIFNDDDGENYTDSL